MTLWPWAFLIPILAVLAAWAKICAYKRRRIATLSHQNLPPRLHRGPAVSGMRGRLYLVGDSRIAQWPLQGPPGWQILRSGFPGQTAPNIAEAMAPLIEAERPELVVIQAGGNDIMAGAFLAEAARPAVVERALAALMAMADRAVAHGARRVVILTVMPPVKPSLMRRMLWGGTVDPGIVALNRAIMALAGPNLSILDVAAVFGPDEDHVKRTYYTNDIHWAPAAYDRLNAALQALLDRDPP